MEVQQGRAFDRFSRLVDGPMTILALLMVPVLLLPYAMRLPAGVADGFDAADYTIWALFAAEYATKLYLAEHRLRYVRDNIPDLIVIAVPFLRPIRALRVLRLLRAAAFATTAVRYVSRVLRHRGLNYVLLVMVLVVFAAAATVLHFEARAPGSSIHNFGDALWWAASTMATVGYGDKVPVTSAGRGVAVLLMIGGVSLFGIVTATLASYFAEQKVDTAEERLAEVTERLERIEALLTTGRRDGQAEFVGAASPGDGDRPMTQSHW